MKPLKKRARLVLSDRDGDKWEIDVTGNYEFRSGHVLFDLITTGRARRIELVEDDEDEVDD